MTGVCEGDFFGISSRREPLNLTVYLSFMEPVGLEKFLNGVKESNSEQS